MEVQVRCVEAVRVGAVGEHAEDEAVPVLDMHGAVEKGLSFHLFAFGRGAVMVDERDGEGVVQSGLAQGGGDDAGVGRSVDVEGDGGSVRQGGGLVGLDGGGDLAEEVIGGEFDPPPWGGAAFGGAGTRSDDRVLAGKAQQSHAGGVLPVDEGFVPAVFAEREQEVRIDDAVTVVAHGHSSGRGSAGRDVHGDAGCARAAAVLEQLDQRVFE